GNALNSRSRPRPLVAARLAQYSRRSAGLVAAVGFALGVVPAFASQSQSPGAVLRAYLDARWRGEVAAAEAMWDPADLRRTTALGTSYEGIESRCDDNLLWTAAERAAMAGVRPHVADSTAAAASDWWRFTVLLPVPGGARTDSLTYAVTKSL